ncbi:MAG: FKBP-type peptidyl-prolyl cis-trans isomerase [Methylobacter sp.]
MRKIQTQLISIVIVILIGFTMFSIANATSPEENKAAGKTFLAENTKKPNIVTTASGLQYEVLTKGKGTASPSATDSVTVHYKGTTLDGEEFDSSYSRGEPATFPLDRVISGWTEGVQLMKEGDKFRFYIPSELAYGEQGAGRSIGPNSTLIFDVELIKIQ